MCMAPRRSNVVAALSRDPAPGTRKGRGLRGGPSRDKRGAGLLATSTVSAILFCGARYRRLLLRFAATKERSKTRSHSGLR